MLIDGTFLLPLQRWLETHFPTARLLVVGGSVRDALRGHPSKDLDLEIVGAQAAEVAAASPWPVQQVGKSYGVLLLQLEGLGWLEVSVEPGSYGDWEQLCRRRDFTCNAIAWEVASQSLVDPLGGGADLQAGVLRAAGPGSMAADPLRVWRAAQFCARFDWRVAPELRADICSVLERMPGLPRERVTREWEKLLIMPRRPSQAVQLLDDWGVIERCYPELWALHGCEQDPEFHPEGDVWVHTLLVLDEAARLGRDLPVGQRLVLSLAALLHDLGKPSTTRREHGRISAHGHEHAGLKPARAWFQRHRFGEAIELAVLDCVSKHMRPMQLVREMDRGKMSPSQQVNALRRLIRDLAHVDWEVFLLLCEADQRGRALPVPEYLPARLFGELLREYPVAAMARAELLRGRDLLALGVPAGKEVGRWIAAVEQARDEGELATSEEALAWVRARLDK
ncbi:MAG: HDIG domain-containing protein [Candidatus Eremiobacteraeota bacterium]|nr:HDIG domain-containing protein [Candidatus Eremiobacteraeota bacterium]